MSVQISKELNDIRERLLKGMLSYMEREEGDDDFDDYSKEDIERCASVLDRYLSSVLDPSMHGVGEGIMEAVKTAVLELNALNEQCGHSLIETDQREDICELIIKAASLAGLNGDDDLTEEWREW
nr:hypothetical protein [uncultured Rhodoferax sp.]